MRINKKINYYYCYCHNYDNFVVGAQSVWKVVASNKVEAGEGKVIDVMLKMLG